MQLFILFLVALKISAVPIDLLNTNQNEHGHSLDMMKPKENDFNVMGHENLLNLNRFKPERSLLWYLSYNTPENVNELISEEFSERLPRFIQKFGYRQTNKQFGRARFSSLL